MWDNVNGGVADPGDVVRIKRDGEYVTGVFKDYWGYPDERDHGYIIKREDGYEEWIETTDIQECEVISRKDAAG